MSAVFATVNFSVFDAIVFRVSPASFTFKSFGPTSVTKPFEAYIFVREIFLKVFDRVLFHLGHPCSYDPSVTYVLRVVKG